MSETINEAMDKVSESLRACGIAIDEDKAREHFAACVAKLSVALDQEWPTDPDQPAPNPLGRLAMAATMVRMVVHTLRVGLGEDIAPRVLRGVLEFLVFPAYEHALSGATGRHPKLTAVVDATEEFVCAPPP